MFYSVTPACYDQLLDRLTDAIGSSNYFSGSLAFDFGGIAYRLRASVIVYRRTERRPEGSFEAICDLVPVWWEFATADDDGRELLNDFSFDELRRRI